MEKRRNQRARAIIRRLNRARHSQAKQIDILCNDIVDAHGDFVRHINCLSYGLGFYEEILGKSDLNVILDTTVNFVTNHINNSISAIFLADCEGFRVHMADQDNPIEMNTRRIEGCFNAALVAKISRSKVICTRDDMYEMGLEGDLKALNLLSVAAVPLKSRGPGLGFILIYRTAEQKLTSRELGYVCSIVPGLCRAIELCQKICQTSAADRH